MSTRLGYEKRVGWVIIFVLAQSKPRHEKKEKTNDEERGGQTHLTLHIDDRTE